MITWWGLTVEQRNDTYTLAKLETGKDWFELTPKEQNRYMFEAISRYTTEEPPC